MADDPTPEKALKAFAIDEKLMDSYEDAIRKSSEAYNQSLSNAITRALSELSTTGDGIIEPNSVNQELLNGFQKRVEDLIRENGLQQQIGDVVDVYRDRLDTLNNMTQAAGFASATVTDFEKFEQLTRRINSFAERVGNGPGPIADEVRNATFRFRNDLSSSNRVRFKDLTDTLTRKAGIMPNYAKTIGNTELMAIDREGRFIQSEQAGVRHLRYTGPLDGLTRDYCRGRVGDVLTREQWQQERNNTGPNPVSRYAGGYNCRHRLILWKNEWEGMDFDEPDLT